MVDTGVILIADDQEDDVLLVRRAFKQANIVNPLQVVRDGEQAIAYLAGEGPFANRTEYPLPTLLLLDLKMPRKNGFDVLEWIRKQPELRRLRVIVLTTSESIRDVNLAYQLGANSFLVKPSDFTEFVAAIRALQGYWLMVSESPQLGQPNQPVIPPDQLKNPPGAEPGNSAARSL